MDDLFVLLETLLPRGLELAEVAAVQHALVDGTLVLAQVGRVGEAGAADVADSADLLVDLVDVTLDGGQSVCLKRAVICKMNPTSCKLYVNTPLLVPF